MSSSFSLDTHAYLWYHLGVKPSSNPPDSPPKVKCPIKKNAVIGIVKRFMKEDAYVPARDPMLFYKAWALFPDEAFWRAYELPFKLNCMAWFLGEEGQAHLKQAIALFHLDMTPATEYHMEDAKVGADVPIVKKKTTMADLLR